MRMLTSHLARVLVAGGMIFGGTAAGVVGTASTASADSGYGLCWQSGCNGKDPVAERCDQNVTTVSSTYYVDPTYGRYEVDLRYSVDCEANWARVVTATARPFCIKNSTGHVQRYTSAPGLASWTNMDDGAPNVSDTAYLKLPEPTDETGSQALYASDQPPSDPKAGTQYKYPC